jgi:hypothetical protein
MRRTNWWGVGAGVVALVGATIIGPTALVANASPRDRQVVTKTSTTSRTSAGRVMAKSKHRPGRHGTNGKPPVKPPVKPGRHHHHHHHEYPPHRDYAVSFDMPDRGTRGQVVTVKVKVTYNSKGVGGVKVGLYNTKDTKSWKLIDSKTAAPDGTVTFSYIINHDAHVKVVAAGGADGKATQSKSLKITLKK